MDLLWNVLRKFPLWAVNSVGVVLLAYSIAAVSGPLCRGPQVMLLFPEVTWPSPTTNGQVSTSHGRSSPSQLRATLQPLEWERKGGKTTEMVNLREMKAKRVSLTSGTWRLSLNSRGTVRVLALKGIFAQLGLKWASSPPTPPPPSRCWVRKKRPSCTSRAPPAMVCRCFLMVTALPVPLPTPRLGSQQKQQRSNKL